MASGSCLICWSSAINFKITSSVFNVGNNCNLAISCWMVWRSTKNCGSFSSCIRKSASLSKLMAVLVFLSNHRLLAATLMRYSASSNSQSFGWFWRKFAICCCCCFCNSRILFSVLYSMLVFSSLSWVLCACCCCANFCENCCTICAWLNCCCFCSSALSCWLNCAFCNSLQ